VGLLAGILHMICASLRRIEKNRPLLIRHGPAVPVTAQ
jgi:hypothetical protein